MRLLLILFLASPALGSPWLDGPTRTAAKPACSCGESCKCENGRIDPRCTCENCKCAIVSGSRGNVEEISHRPCEANAPKTSTPAKAGTKGCELCGVKCDCRDCKCTATTWREGCRAIPAGYTEAYYRSLQSQTYYYPPTSQPMYRQTYHPAYQLPTYYTPRGTAANCGPTG
jgi:hypothetical protein